MSGGFALEFIHPIAVLIVKDVEDWFMDDDDDDVNLVFLQLVIL